MRYAGYVLLLCFIALSGRPTSAHHAFNTTYDEKDRVTLTGTVTKMEWVNPHCRIYLDVKGRDGRVAKWSVETAPPGVLTSRGVRKEDFGAGTVLTIDGYRSKTTPMTGAARTVRLADGTELFVR